MISLGDNTESKSMAFGRREAWVCPAPTWTKALRQNNTN